MKQTKNQCLSKEIDDTKRNQVEISELKNTVIEKGMDRTEKRVNLKKEQYKFPSLNIERIDGTSGTKSKVLTFISLGSQTKRRKGGTEK